jgi:hypothetical protein
MDFYISEVGFEPKYSYSFYDLDERLCTLKSNRRIEKGQIIFLNKFIWTYLMKVTRTWGENETHFVTFESLEVPLCVVDLE